MTQGLRKEIEQIIKLKKIECTVKTFKDIVNWHIISLHQNLSESFIEKFKDNINWIYISTYQKLSEEFIEKHKDKVVWNWISIYQKLSEVFIENFKDDVYWWEISLMQKLSEAFIETHKDDVSWNLISKYQKLTETFIEKNKDYVDWQNISAYQKLSESFIEKYKNYVDWQNISAYQKLSESFIKKHNLEMPEDSWMYKSANFKKQAIKDSGLYEMHEDYFIAYKAIRNDRHSHYNFQYQYLKDGTYEAHADFTTEENSFGLSVWIKRKAIEFNNTGKIVKVKVFYKDVARMIHHNGKIRCTKITILS